MASIIKVDEIEEKTAGSGITLKHGLKNSTGTEIISAAGALSGNVTFPAGHIVQVKQTVKTDYFDSQSSTFVDITGLSVSITPNFSTSKILVMWSVATSGNNHFDLRLARFLDSVETAPYVGDQLGSNRTRSTHHHYTTTSYNTTYNMMSDNGQFLDSPNTTNSVTYKMQCACPNSSSYYIRIGYPYSTQDLKWSASNPSSITVMEIVG